jgi:microcystin-dependent protein
MNKATYTGWPSSNFPLSTEGLDFMQEQLLLAAEYAKSAGGNYIISGCTVSGTTAAAGVMVLAGEIIRFSGGTLQSTVRVKETATDITAGSVTYTGAYKNRIAEFGSNIGGTETYNWADIKPFPTNAYLEANKATKAELEALQNLAMPKGGIIMWSGSIVSIPSGWSLCDGRTENGVLTPNLSGRFIVGYDAASNNLPVNVTDGKQENYAAIRNTGGKTTVQLTADESGVPEHSHPYNEYQHISSAQNRVVTGAYGAINSNNTGNNTPQDAAQAHENRPPYYVLAFIMKTV